MRPRPPAYGWLATFDPLPSMIAEALKLFGTVEAAATANSPTILSWADEVGGKVGDVYRANSIPWCGLCSWPSSPSGRGKKCPPIPCGRSTGRGSGSLRVSQCWAMCRQSRIRRNHLGRRARVARARCADHQGSTELPRRIIFRSRCWNDGKSRAA